MRPPAARPPTFQIAVNATALFTMKMDWAVSGKLLESMEDSARNSCVCVCVCVCVWCVSACVCARVWRGCVCECLVVL